MPEMLTIHLAHPVAATRVADALDAPSQVQGSELQIRNLRSEIQNQEGRSQELAQLCGLVKSLADQFRRLHEETVANHRGDVARLAVEIARKILAQKVTSGDYDIQAVIEEALKRAPTHQNIVVRVNPQDLPACQRLRQKDAEGPFAALEFVADRSIARADCLVETPKGIIRSFVEQHLERIGEALGRVE